MITMEENKDIKKRPTKDEIVKGKIANALTSAAKNHIVATTDDIYDTNFLEYQDEINKRIIDVIPEEASETNQLADKDYVNELIAKSSSYFRGSWENWAAVPTDASEYPEDTKGNRIPRLGDYLVIEDASDYDVESGLTGTWRFTYTGEWETDGKSGWVKEYQINEEAQVTISFYRKYEGDSDENAEFITEKKITKTDTLLSYPQLTENEFKDGGYWDTMITDLRNVNEEHNVTYVIPISYNENIFNNSQLIELCYENNWCSSPEYITLSEMENLTTEN